TEDFLKNDLSNDHEIEAFTSNRERLFHIIDQISKEVDWSAIPIDKKEEANRRIDYIKKLDTDLLCKLQTFKEEVKKEVEITSRQKESIKGYNLTDVK